MRNAQVAVPGTIRNGASCMCTVLLSFLSICAVDDFALKLLLLLSPSMRLSVSARAFWIPSLHLIITLVRVNVPC